MTTHKMKLTAEPFDKIKDGSKIIEVRLFDEKRKDINLGDEIVFTKQPEETEELRAQVVGLLRFPTFKDLFNDFPPEYFGHTDREGLTSKVYQFYTLEQEKEFGVLGIKIRLL